MLDIEKLIREGKSLDEIGKMVTNEMNVAQKKIDAEKEAARIAARKKKEAEEATAKKRETLNHYREAAVAAFSSYLSLVLGEEIPEDMIRTAIVDLEQSIEAIKSIKVSVNGKDIKSILDLLF